MLYSRGIRFDLFWILWISGYRKWVPSASADQKALIGQLGLKLGSVRHAWLAHMV
jgi:hypothetical protein